MTQANYQRSVSPSSQNHIGLVFVNHQNGESSVQTIYHIAKRLQQIAVFVVLTSNQVGSDLAVGV